MISSRPCHMAILMLCLMALPALPAGAGPALVQAQLDTFRQVVPYRSLGVVVAADTPAEHALAQAVAATATRQGVALEICHADSDASGRDAVHDALLQCYRQLAHSEIDAVYVLRHEAADDLMLGRVAALLRDARLPTFSMDGSRGTRLGMLMGWSDAAGDAGCTPACKGGDPPLALNLDTMRRVGFDPPVDVLLATDEIHGMP